MSQTCPHCGAELPWVSAAFCSECRNELDDVPHCKDKSLPAAEHPLSSNKKPTPAPPSSGSAVKGILSKIKRRWRLWLFAAIFLGVLATFLHPSVYWPVVGKIRGEAFYKDRPTSYWKSQALVFYKWDTEQSLGETPPERSWFRKLFPPEGPFGFLNEVMEGDASFQPVLKEMLNDPDPTVRKFGEWGLSNLGSAKQLMQE
jgi:hypothetical protein